MSKTKKSYLDDFKAPTIKDLGLEEEIDAAKKVAQEEKARVSKRKENLLLSSVDENNVTKTKVDKINVDENNIIEKEADETSLVETPKPKKETLHFKAIRDYLNKLLGDQEEIEVKLTVVQNELGITGVTFYKHLKVLRDTEFEIKKKRYITSVKRKK